MRQLKEHIWSQIVRQLYWQIRRKLWKGLELKLVGQLYWQIDWQLENQLKEEFN